MNKTNTTLDIKQTRLSNSKKTAIMAVMSALIAVTTMIAIPLPPPLSTINLAPIIIFTTCILFGPIIGVSSTLIGCLIGYLAGTSTGTIMIPPGFLYIYLFGLLAARAPMALAASALQKKSEIAGMTLGVIIETAVFFTIDFALFGIGFAVFDLAVLIDAAFIPVTIAVLLGVRKVFGVKYFA